MSKNNVKELLKTYIVGADGSAEIDTEAFVHTVGYVKDGKITDFLYDSFIFLPQPNYLYDYAPGGTGGRKPMNKAEWTDYIENEEFKSGMNVNALNEATGIVKKELCNSDYKSHVFLSIFYPHNDMHEFGEVDGENLDLLDVENKKKALKWMVDKSIEEFNKRNYEHIDLGGFYWFYESISMKPEEHNEEFLQYITNYIRSLGYITVWSPWYGAPGNETWQKYGFDMAGQQANYFPEHKSWPNQGGKDRLPGLSAKIEKFGCSAEIEMADFAERSAEVVNDYYAEGAKAGWMHSYHLYYMSVGPKFIEKLSKTDNEKLRSAYDNTYRFIKGIYNSDNE